MRLASALLATSLILASALPGAALGAERAAPKVVVIVGPAGRATDGYREQAEAAARVAERHTPNVVRLYSPDATWPAVREALQGAAIVVYLGHGNGWPSRYRDAPFGGSQNGFGLNPVAGGGDDAHQYFGEDRIAADVSLAPGAVVLLHHLCYASGNTEPGLPEGTLDQAKQRVDNYAAGFLRAGAGAVVAEATMGPAWYVERLLTGRRSIDRLWRGSPSANGHELGFASVRSPGHAVAMDPERAASGFYRSIVYRGGVGAGRLPSSPLAVDAGPLEPSLVGSGLEVGAAYFKTRPLAGAKADLWLPFSATDVSRLKGLTVGFRWDPIDVAGLPDESAAPEEAAATEPQAAGNGAAGSEGSTPAPAATEAPAEARFVTVEPERLGSVVEPVAASVGKTRIVAPLTLPDRPGRYRLVTTFHDTGGVAYDAPTQALLPALIVRVSGELDARYLVAGSVTIAAGDTLRLPLALANVGAEAWGQEGVAGETLRNLEERSRSAVLAVHWVRLDAPAGALPEDQYARLPAGLRPGGTVRLPLQLAGPTQPGAYLLVIDVVAPGLGSLAASGVEPALVRVTVE